MPRMLKRSVTPVTNRAARLDVERHGADRQRGLITKTGGKLQKALDVGEIADEAKRDADRAGTLATVLHDLKEARQRDVDPLRHSCKHVVLRHTLGRLAGARITET